MAGDILSPELLPLTLGHPES